jgi:hypothetical protein
MANSESTVSGSIATKFTAGAAMDCIENSASDPDLPEPIGKHKKPFYRDEQEKTFEPPAPFSRSRTQRRKDKHNIDSL